MANGGGIPQIGDVPELYAAIGLADGQHAAVVTEGKVNGGGGRPVWDGEPTGGIGIFQRYAFAVEDSQRRAAAGAKPQLGNALDSGVAMECRHGGGAGGI